MEEEEKVEVGADFRLARLSDPRWELYYYLRRNIFPTPPGPCTLGLLAFLWLLYYSLSLSITYTWLFTGPSTPGALNLSSSPY
jgi:hypothetical protein